MPPLEMRTDSPGRLQKYPKNHVSTGELFSGSGTDSTQGIRRRHRRERNSEMAPNNSHGDWPFLRKPERVSEVPIVSREHLPQLEKIQEVLPSRRVRPISLRRLEANHTEPLELPKDPSNPCCNSRRSPTYPSPLERKHESPAHIQRSSVSAS